MVRVTRSGWYLQGEETRAFEEVFAGYCGTRYCIGVGNGLDALTLIFMAYRELGEMQPGDEVIVPANTYIASILSVVRAGLKPVFCEPSFDSCNIAPEAIETLINSRTKAILPVHLYGRCADMQPILNIAASYRLKVVMLHNRMGRFIMENVPVILEMRPDSVSIRQKILELWEMAVQ